ncbi:hypothetical protein [Streptomyces sp. MST-110588]|uniref:hypothetical protein n=1 Tax=Streptomyces sp. MST-110588 TaxID=2833628 RepID=UPI001F5D6F15|nr:hypothetical protein [Streptomyces sp. MST-110588]UNO41447.1 hypothetical protein KGS77_20085 [Streptomyces sp. MST-110588]
MTGAIRALAAALAVLAAAVGAGLALPGTAAAVDTGRGRAGFCPGTNGVTVVVDFRELGGSVIVRCAVGRQSTGLAALKAAGIRVTGTNRWGEAFICRLENKPGPERETCIDTPPTRAYWSYWHAPNGGRWTYSQYGATYRTPPAGSFEGWSFSLNRDEGGAPAPRIAPRRPAPAPAPGDGDGGSGGGGTQGGGQGGNSGSSGGSGASGGSGGGSDSGTSAGDGSPAGGTGTSSAGNGDDSYGRREPGRTTDPREDEDMDRQPRNDEQEKAKDKAESREPGEAQGDGGGNGEEGDGSYAPSAPRAASGAPVPVPTEAPAGTAARTGRPRTPPTTAASPSGR